jgi:hypothetical protein
VLSVTVRSCITEFGGGGDDDDDDNDANKNRKLSL